MKPLTVLTDKGGGDYEACKHLHGPVVAALLRVNGAATAHTVTTLTDLVTVARRAEALLTKRGIARSSWTGVEVTYVPAGPYARAYKYNTVTTHVTLKRRRDRWVLINAVRDYQAPKAPEHFRIYVSDSLAETIKRRAMDGFAVEEKRNDCR